MYRLSLMGLLLAMPALAESLPVSKNGKFVQNGSVASANATQAAAADEDHFYAISNTRIVKYDRKTNRELATSTGPAEHLNSGFFWKGKLYCAHSNYPKKPDESDIRVLDPESMKLTIYKEFKNPPGSLTWAIFKDESWWCCFAHYKQDNHKTVLIQYNQDWKELKRYSFPEKLISDWEEASLSGGIWMGDHLLATGHDREVVYKLKIPDKGSIVQLVDLFASPFPGQGIAFDPVTKGLVGIHRAKRQVVFAQWEAK